MACGTLILVAAPPSLYLSFSMMPSCEDERPALLRKEQDMEIWFALALAGMLGLKGAALFAIVYFGARLAIRHERHASH